MEKNWKKSYQLSVNDKHIPHFLINLFIYLSDLCFTLYHMKAGGIMLEGIQAGHQITTINSTFQHMSL